MTTTRSRAARLRSAVLLSGLLLAASAALGATNPVPLINQPLVPDAVSPGGPGFTLTVNGTGFVSGATVDWNGAALSTQFVSGSQLTATVPASDVATAGTAYVTVVNPAGEPSAAMPLSIATPASILAFAPGAAYPTATAPVAVALADVNGDGYLDAVVLGQSNLSILLGNGDGTFQAPTEYAVPFGPGTPPVVADFNGDGKLDIAVTGQNPGPDYIVSVMLGNGDGTFQAPINWNLGLEPEALATGDLNGDGNLDLVVSIYGGFGVTKEIAVLLGNGDGTFQTPQTYATASNAFAIGVGDLNGDGILDLAVMTYYGASILIGNGDGTFQPQVAYPNHGAASGVVVADLNGDGKLDLVSANQSDAIVLVGNGDGSFQAPVAYSVGSSVGWVTAADFTSDNKLDVALPDVGQVAVLLGNGDGTFQEPQTFLPPANNDLTWVAAGDLNGDGRPDLLTVNRQGSSVSVLLNTQSPVASLSPTSLTFAEQAVGIASVPQTVKLTNTGASNLEISSIVATTNFIETNTCGSTVAPGATCSIYVSFKPTVKGPLTGSVTITDNAGNTPQTISLSGTGTLAELTPTSINFGSIPAGTSTSQPATLTNVGTVPLDISHISIDEGGFYQSNNCGASLAAQASCTITITFSPFSGSPETYYGTLDVSDSGGGSPQTVSLSGTGTAPAVTFSPGSLTFTNQLVGTSSTVQSTSLTNSGNSVLNITSVSITGANAGAFAQSNTCGSTLAAGASCTLSVTFSPTAAGTRTASLSIADNAAYSPQTAPLYGTGTFFSLSPTSINFGDVTTGQTSAPQTVTLTNAATISESVSIRISGGTSGDFAETNTCGSSLGARASCSISVTFTPTFNGTAKSSVQVSGGGGTNLIVALSGTGIS